MMPSHTINLPSMSELTKEYFEQHLKRELGAQTTELKTYAREQTEELARITSAGFARTEERFDDLEKRLDVTAQLKMFERKFKKLEEALHITL